METRRDDSGIYRRRGCGFCGKTYVTLETSPDGLRMPAKFQSSKRKASGCVRTGVGAMVEGARREGVRVTSGELFSVWRG